MRRLVCSLGEVGGAASSICYLPSIRPCSAQLRLERLLARKCPTRPASGVCVAVLGKGHT